MHFENILSFDLVFLSRPCMNKVKNSKAMKDDAHTSLSPSLCPAQLTQPFFPEVKRMTSISCPTPDSENMNISINIHSIYIFIYTPHRWECSVCSVSLLAFCGSSTTILFLPQNVYNAQAH